MHSCACDGPNAVNEPFKGRQSHKMKNLTWVPVTWNLKMAVNDPQNGLPSHTFVNFASFDRQRRPAMGTHTMGGGREPWTPDHIWAGVAHTPPLTQQGQGPLNSPQVACKGRELMPHPSYDGGVVSERGGHDPPPPPVECGVEWWGCLEGWG